MLNINSAISLTSTNSTGQGLLTDDSIDTKFTVRLSSFSFRGCRTVLISDYSKSFTSNGRRANRKRYLSGMSGPEEVLVERAR